MMSSKLCASKVLDQLVNIMTRGVSESSFHHLSSKMNICDIYTLRVEFTCVFVSIHVCAL